MPKAKSKGGGCDKNSDIICIVHATNISEHGNFTPLSATKCDPHKKKLSWLHKIRTSRLSEPLDSPNRHEDSCKLLPDKLEACDSSIVVGYHRQCYARFTKNLERLATPPFLDEDTKTNPTHKPSPIKRSVDGGIVFVPSCIFCGQLTKRLTSQREHVKDFPHWTHKDSRWTNIVQHAYEMGEMSLYRLVNDVDLHAKNAKFHQSCYNSFCVRYQHHIEKQNMRKDSESDAQSDAHMHAYESVRKYVKETVLNNNEVVSLASLREYM